jgi:hypothetical protein
MARGFPVAAVFWAIVTFVSIPPAFAFEEPFRAGERLLFTANWWGFEAGFVEASVPEIFSEGDKRYARFSLHTWTANTIGYLFRMDDKFEASWDVDAHVPRNFSATIRESHAHRDKRMEFDHAAGLVTVYEDNKPPKRFPIRPTTQDFFSASYLTRMDALEPKSTFLAPIFEDNKNYDAKIYSVKKERIRVLGGQLDTVLITAMLGFEGAFEKSKTVNIWLSDDDQHAPVKIEMSFAFGTVSLNLVKAEGVDLKIIKTEGEK